MSTTGGSTWNESKNMVPGYGQMALGSVIICGKNYDSPYAMSVSKSSDDGLNWQTNTLTSNAGCLYAMAVHPSNKNSLFAAGSEIVSNSEQYALFKSTDAGSSWIRSGLTGNGELRAIIYDPKNSNHLYLGSSNGVLTSTDGGTNWQNPSTQVWINCLLADPNTANKVYAGTGSGVYVTTNGGANWNPMNTELTSTIVQCLEMDLVHNILYAGTNGGGVFRTSIATGVEDEPPFMEKPVQFVLQQNFPNPFNASTEIRYELKKTEKVRLSVLDLRGRTIRILSDGVQSDGMNRAVWDGKDGLGREVPGGIYFSRLEMEYESAVRKLVLQK